MLLHVCWMCKVNVCSLYRHYKMTKCLFVACFCCPQVAKILIIAGLRFSSLTLSPLSICYYMILYLKLLEAKLKYLNKQFDERLKFNNQIHYRNQISMLRVLLNSDPGYSSHLLRKSPNSAM